MTNPSDWLSPQPGRCAECGHTYQGLEAGLPPFEPLWFDWFSARRRCQQAKQYDKGIACYRTESLGVRAAEMLKQLHDAGPIDGLAAEAVTQTNSIPKKP